MVDAAHTDGCQVYSSASTGKARLRDWPIGSAWATLRQLRGPTDAGPHTAATTRRGTAPHLAVVRKATATLLIVFS